MLKVLCIYVLILQMRLTYKLKTRLVRSAFWLLEKPDNEADQETFVQTGLAQAASPNRAASCQCHLAMCAKGGAA